ncbi:MAG TPA: hypothetical protein GX710_00355 [Clostridiales bacterium]|nr:hypothetical protein [Clostridiales bacterium]
MTKLNAHTIVKKSNAILENKALLFLLGGIIGAIIFIMIYGVKGINPTYDAWLYTNGDLTQHYIGWQFFRDSDWSFPLGLTDGLVYPNAISCMFTDSIPIFALFFKLLSPILPETFQYFGIWGIMCFFLQGAISILIIRKFTDNKIYCIIGSVFFALSPCVIQRMFGHTALDGHWIILLTILIWVYKDEINTIPKSILAWGGLGFIAPLVHMYFVPMVFIMLAGWLLRDLIETKKIVKQIIIGISTTGITLITMYVVGAFYGKADFSDAGIGVYSSNLNTFFNPLNGLSSTQSYSKMIKLLPTLGNAQGEGFAYLGLGMILLCFYVVTQVIRYISENGIKESLSLIKTNYKLLIPLAISLGILTFLAVFPVVTLNGRTLFTLTYPDFIVRKLSIFRASGRFIWVLYYFVYTVAILAVTKLNKKSVGISVMIICLCVQFVDLREIHFNLGSRFSYAGEASQLSSDKWDELGEDCEHIVFAPMDMGYLTRGAEYFSFARLAKEYDMTLSSFYVARVSYDELDSYAQ